MMKQIGITVEKIANGYLVELPMANQLSFESVHDIKKFWKETAKELRADEEADPLLKKIYQENANRDVATSPQADLRCMFAKDLETVYKYIGMYYDGKFGV